MTFVVPYKSSICPSFSHISPSRKVIQSNWVFRTTELLSYPQNKFGIELFELLTQEVEGIHF